ncbi:MAG TPA: CocE/NonD family hydrolase [Conexibacter sp.]|jgi:predicted acyl esterase|nr:CocE/NonD family hydrolase [Conexibacter sp.]
MDGDGNVSIQVLRDVAVPLRDGTVTRAEVWLPEGGGPHPAILTRTIVPVDGPPTLQPLMDQRLATSRGYAVVLQEVRGRGSSEGDFEPFVNEAADGADSIAWIAEQDWCDGRVVMTGASVLGAAQWLAASASPPALRAIAPTISSDELAEGWSLTGGVPEHGFLSTWSAVTLAPLGERWLDATERALDDLAGLERIAPWISDWYGPADSDYWAALSVSSRRDQVEVPVFAAGGWYDIFLAGTLASFARSRDPRDRLVIGPWGHDPFLSWLIGDVNAGIDGAGLGRLFPWSLDFYDAVIAGREPDAPRVRAYVMNARRWLALDAWPPPAASSSTVALATASFDVDPGDPVPSRGGRGFTPGLPDAGWGVRDQRPTAARADVVEAASTTLEQATLLAGPVTAHLRTSADGDGACLWTATLCHEQADGALHNLCDGVATAAADGGEVELSLGHVCVALPAGARLVLLVAGSSFPRWPRPQRARTQSLREGGRLELTVAPYELLDSAAPTKG